MTLAAVRLLAVAPALSAYLHPSARRSRLDHTRMSAVDGESKAPLPAGLEKQVLRSGEAFRGEAEKMATLILKPKRTDDETAYTLETRPPRHVTPNACHSKTERPPPSRLGCFHSLAALRTASDVPVSRTAARRGRRRSHG